MNFSDINPYIRFFWTRKIGEDYSEHLLAYDFRLFYGLQGKVIIETEGKSFVLVPNSFVVIPPATPYILKCHPDYESEHLFCIFNFDMNCQKSDHKLSIRPQPKHLFKPETVISTDTPQETAQSSLFEGDHRTTDMIKEIERLFSSRPKFYREESGALLKQIITVGMRRLIEKDTETPKEINAVLTFIREHYKEPVTNALIAGQFKYHPNHLNRMFKAHMGTSLHSYIISYRLKIAKELIIGTDCKIEEVAREAGFDSPSYFAKYFRKKYGISPLEYRNK